MNALTVILILLLIAVAVAFGLNVAGYYKIPGQQEDCPACKDCPTIHTPVVVPVPMHHAN